MPILDLRIRKAVRRHGASLLVATERPSALDGGADEAVRYAPGRGRRLPRRPGRAPSAASRLEAAPYAKEAAGVAEALQGRPRPGDRLGRAPLARARRRRGPARRRHGARHRRAHRPRACSRSPSEANGRGLREVGCLPGAGPGLADAPAGRDAAGIRDDLAAGRRLRAPLQRRPGPHPPRLRRLAQGAVKATSSSPSSTFDDESTQHANIVLPAETHAEKEGTVTHPDGRLQRLRPQRPPPRRGPPRLAGRSREPRPALGIDLDLASQPAVLDGDGRGRRHLRGHHQRGDRRHAASAGRSASPGRHPGPSAERRRLRVSRRGLAATAATAIARPRPPAAPDGLCARAPTATSGPTRSPSATRRCGS